MLIAFIFVGILTPISWVRNIADFKISFLIGNLSILLAFIVVLAFCSVQLHDEGPAEELVPLNTANYSVMLGFAAYCFEGIGIVMPTMQRTENKE